MGCEGRKGRGLGCICVCFRCVDMHSMASSSFYWGLHGSGVLPLESVDIQTVFL